MFSCCRSFFCFYVFLMSPFILFLCYTAKVIFEFSFIFIIHCSTLVLVITFLFILTSIFIYIYPCKGAVISASINIIRVHTHIQTDILFIPFQIYNYTLIYICIFLMSILVILHNRTSSCVYMYDDVYVTFSSHIRFYMYICIYTICYFYLSYIFTDYSHPQFYQNSYFYWKLLSKLYKYMYWYWYWCSYICWHCQLFFLLSISVYELLHLLLF